MPMELSRSRGASGDGAECRVIPGTDPGMEKGHEREKLRESQGFPGASVVKNHLPRKTKKFNFILPRLGNEW